MKINREQVIAIFVIAIVGLLLLQTQLKNFTPPSYHITNRVITFPKAEDTLKVGKTYTIKWTPKPGTTDLFLINRAAESEGVSVSIADRVYDINNSGSIKYTVPKNIPSGEYKITIGDISSSYFNISK